MTGGVGQLPVSSQLETNRRGGNRKTKTEREGKINEGWDPSFSIFIFAYPWLGSMEARLELTNGGNDSRTGGCSSGHE